MTDTRDQPRITSPCCPRCEKRLSAPPPDSPGSWVCASCAGTWLESEAFARVCAQATVAADPGKPRRRELVEPVRYALCPACSSVMARVDIGSANGITVDVCRHGVWLDRGELEALKQMERNDDVIRLEAAQRMAPLLERNRDALFAQLRLDDPMLDGRLLPAADNVLQFLVRILIHH